MLDKAKVKVSEAIVIDQRKSRLATPEWFSFILPGLSYFSIYGIRFEEALHEMIVPIGVDGSSYRV